MPDNLHYKLPSGECISKRSVDNALALLNKVTASGCQLVSLTDSELFSYGDKLTAIQRFREKYDAGILEAKQTIEYLRGEEVT